MLFYAATLMWLAASTLWSFAFVVPAAAFVPVALNRRPTFPEWFALSMGLGYATAMLLGWIALAGGRAAMVTALIVGAAAAGSMDGLRWPHLPRGPQSFGRVWAGLTVGAVVVSLLPRIAYQLRVGPWPRGWDPMMHLTIVRAMQLQHGLPWTLLPLDDAHVNYPWGSHLAIVAQSAISGEYPHSAFAAHNSVFLSIVTMASVLLFAWRAFRDPAVALAAMLVYANVIHFGGADYQNWGGLPNHAGMALLFAGLALLLSEPDSRERPIGVVLVGAAFLTHHHVMICGLAAIAIYAGAAALGGHGAAARHALRDGVVALVIATPILIVLGAHIGDARRVPLLAGREQFDWLTMWRDYIGFPGVVLAAAGLVLTRHTTSRHREMPSVFLAATLLMFGVFGGVWRMVTAARFGQPFIALTPSRFLTDAAYPAAVLGGLAVAAIVGRGRGAIWRAALIAPLIFGEQWIWMQSRHEEPPHLRALGMLLPLADMLPPDAAIVTRFEGDGYAGYVFAREVMDPPRPWSPPTERGREKKAFADSVLEGRADRQLRRRLFGTRPVWVVAEAPLPPGVVAKQALGTIVAGELPQ